jgi:hypothetical protein
MHDLGVETIPLVRLHGVDSDTAYFEHTMSGGPVLCEEMDTLVLSLGHESVAELESELAAYPGEVIPIGDCLCVRTAEEAVLEGLEAGNTL